MNISGAKQVRIVDYLRQLGHKPHHEKYRQYWYLSPLRQEKTASFCVNDRKNVWYDFGLAAGGDLVELGKYLYQTDDVSEILSHIEIHARNCAVARVVIDTADTPPLARQMKNVAVVALQHNALLSYLRTRQIDPDIARAFCREVHYDLRRRHYFAIAFGNMSGGYEVRNSYYKGCIIGKDITVVKYRKGETQQCACVFEGFMDFLTYLTLKRSKDDDICTAQATDYIIMNSISNLKRTLMQLEEYRFIYCYLDNDLAGQKTAETIASLYEGRVSDRSSAYSEYKDLNDYIRGRKR